jgi:dihydroorotate dehydrogenase (NAD+) catalytic subunit
VNAVRKVTQKTLITKLSPNVTDITEIAMAAQNAGSDAASLINTLTAMCIDVEARKSKIGMVTAGLSGPAVRPVAVRMVWEAYRKIKIPIIGMGGIIDISSALEFIIAGATAVAVGTANFINPKVTVEIISGIKRYLVKNKIKDIRKLIGSIKIES